MKIKPLYCIITTILLSCGDNNATLIKTVPANTPADTTLAKNEPLPFPYDTPSENNINTGTTTPQQLVAFANTLIGIPYKYGSFNPEEGFDCSGFITYVFNHFDIAVPRSSVDFTHVDREIALNLAQTGDLILFTGTDSSIRTVGHMGIVVSAAGHPVQFIHSTSGKANGVTITPLNTYYMGRFVKIIRIFPQNK